MKEKRYEVCEQCGRRWNVSACARFYAGVYVCPRCAEGSRRGKDATRAKSAGQSPKR